MESMTFPQEIDRKTYIPARGDKIERTYRTSGTVVVGIVNEVIQYDVFESQARTFDGFVIYDSEPSSESSYRLLAEAIIVGKVINASQARDMPYGTVLQRVFEDGVEHYEIVIVMGAHSTRYFRATATNRSWPNITGQWRVKYIPEE